eukprot:5051854-Amphidinium_carterae.1
MLTEARKLKGTHSVAAEQLFVGITGVWQYLHRFFSVLSVNEVPDFEQAATMSMAAGHFCARSGSRELTSAILRMRSKFPQMKPWLTLQHRIEEILTLTRRPQDRPQWFSELGFRVQYLHPGGYLLTNSNHPKIALLLDDLTSTEAAKLMSEMCASQWTSYVLEDTEPDVKAGELLRQRIGETVAEIMKSTDDIETVAFARNRHLVWYAFRAAQMGASTENVNSILRSGVRYDNGLIVKADISTLYLRTTQDLARLECHEAFKDAILKTYHLMPGLPYLPDALFTKLSSHITNTRKSSKREDLEFQAFARLLLVSMHITRGARTSGHFADSIFEFALVRERSARLGEDYNVAMEQLVKETLKSSSIHESAYRVVKKLNDSELDNAAHCLFPIFSTSTDIDASVLRARAARFVNPSNLKSRKAADRLTIASVAERGLSYIVLRSGATETPQQNLDRATAELRQQTKDGKSASESECDQGRNSTDVPASTKNEQKENPRPLFSAPPSLRNKLSFFNSLAQEISLTIGCVTTSTSSEDTRAADYNSARLTHRRLGPGL